MDLEELKFKVKPREFYNQKIKRVKRITNWSRDYENIKELIENSFNLENDKVKIHKKYYGLIVNHCKNYCNKIPKYNVCFLNDDCKR